LLLDVHMLKNGFGSSAMIRGSSADLHC
jgi:hypothetical protein